MPVQSNFRGGKLDKTQEFQLIYSGPSFDSGIKIESLVKNLSAIHDLIYTITDINLEHKKGYYGKENIQQIKVIAKSGSFEEQIIILLSNPETLHIITDVLISLFFYLLGRRDARRDTSEIKALIAREQSKNIKSLYQQQHKAAYKEKHAQIEQL